MYPKLSFEPKYDAINMKNKSSAHGSGLVVHLSVRVAPPWGPKSDESGLKKTSLLNYNIVQQILVFKAI